MRNTKKSNVKRNDIKKKGGKTTFHFHLTEKLAVVHRDERVAEERAEEIEERNDAVGVLERHGRSSRDQLQQWHHGAERAERQTGRD